MSSQTNPSSARDGADGTPGRSAEASTDGPTRRLAAIDWGAIEREIGAQGYAVTAPLLSAAQCRDLSVLFDDERRFRKRVVMARHGYGSGTYAYFAEPLPTVVETLRAGLYARLARLQFEAGAEAMRENGETATVAAVRS